MLPTGIRGFVYEDVDGNGAYNPASWNLEASIAGRTVFLDANKDGQLNDGETSAISGIDGSYVFDNLLAGDYRVAQVFPAGWLLTSPNGGIYTVALGDGQTVSGRDFGNFQAGIINGVKFSDLDADGMREPGELALAGWTVFLDTNENGLLDNGEASVITGDDGVFSFTDIAPGTVLIGEVGQGGWQRTTSNPLTPSRAASPSAPTLATSNSAASAVSSSTTSTVMASSIVANPASKAGPSSWMPMPMVSWIPAKPRR